MNGLWSKKKYDLVETTHPPHQFIEVKLHFFKSSFPLSLSIYLVSEMHSTSNAKHFIYLIIVSLIQSSVANNEVNSDIYDIGVGIADITGQAADVGMVNYLLLFLIIT